MSRGIVSICWFHLTSSIPQNSAPEMSKPTVDHLESQGPLEYQDPADQEQGPEYTKHDAPNNVVDSKLERRVIRKIDLMIIPFICITYLITYIDKAMLGYAAVFGLKESLHLKGTEYSWLGK